MEEGVYHEHHLFTRRHAAVDDIGHDVLYVGDLAHVVSRHALREAGRAARVHDVGEVVVRVDRHLRGLRPVLLDEAPEGIDLLAFLDLSLGYLVEEPADDLLPDRDQLDEVGDDDALQLRLFHDLLDVDEVRVETYDRLYMRVLYHVLYFVGRVDGGDGDHDGPYLVYGEVRDDPLRAVRDIEHDAVLRLYPYLHESRGEPVDKHGEPAVAVPLAEVVEGGIPRLFLGHRLEPGECVRLFIRFHDRSFPRLDAEVGGPHVRVVDELLLRP